MLEVCDLQDLRFKGNQFSWDGIVECCLDRLLLISAWRQSFPISETEFLDLAESDHRRMIVYEERIKRGQFHYDKQLTQEIDFVETVRHFWNYKSTYITDFSMLFKECGLQGLDRFGLKAIIWNYQIKSIGMKRVQSCIQKLPSLLIGTGQSREESSRG